MSKLSVFKRIKKAMQNIINAGDNLDERLDILDNIIHTPGIENYPDYLNVFLSDRRNTIRIKLHKNIS